jgi:hypothetical protein
MRRSRVRFSLWAPLAQLISEVDSIGTHADQSFAGLLLAHIVHLEQQGREALATSDSTTYASGTPARQLDVGEALPAVAAERVGRLFRWTPETVEGQGVDAILEGVGALTELQRIAGSKVVSDRVA